MSSKTLLLPLVAGALLAAGCGSSNSSSSTTTAAGSTRPTATASAAADPVSVSLSEWKIAPSATTAKAGDITFNVTNTGKTVHEFVVLRTSKPAADLGQGARIKETGHVGETGDIKAGGSKSVTLKLPPGHYALVCNLPDHYRSGMRTDFTVS